MAGCNVPYITSTWCSNHMIHNCEQCIKDKQMGACNHGHPFIALCREVECRLVRLEDYLNRQIDENRKVSRRIDELVEHLKEYHEIVLGASPIEIEKMNRKKPHKCPVCDGNGDFKTARLEIGKTYNVNSGNEVCKPCEGKGVLWG